ncbi:hypothetical protein L3X38_032174 [Prunus dulcis]|uniref:Tf2-1-like SH3-like domain-containing protein n=1 Tax=Prunus dulcis TaxID=3755 RepID=A0AAD4VFU0_PRUDU|nr:hypothetical protein L3X38_032174 [Prunus dulcis]
MAQEVMRFEFFKELYEVDEDFKEIWFKCVRTQPVIDFHLMDVKNEVKERLEKTNAKHKAIADKHKRVKVFNEGDSIMVYMKKERFPMGAHHKLQPRKYGPYKILKKINDNAYVADFPPSMEISSTFNVADLHAFNKDDMLYLEDNSGSNSFEVEATDVEHMAESIEEQMDSSAHNRNNKVQSVLVWPMSSESGP